MPFRVDFVQSNYLILLQVQLSCGQLMSLVIWVLPTSALVIGCWFVKFKVCKYRGRNSHFANIPEILNVTFKTWTFNSWNSTVEILRSSFWTWDVYSPSMFQSVLHTLISRNLSSNRDRNVHMIGSQLHPLKWIQSLKWFLECFNRQKWGEKLVKLTKFLYLIFSV